MSSEYAQLERGDCGCGRRYVWLYQRVGTLLRGCGKCVQRMELGQIVNDPRLSEAPEPHSKATGLRSMTPKAWARRRRQMQGRAA